MADTAMVVLADGATGEGGLREATGMQACDIILKPLSHPELGEIGIDENLFAVGRTEPPFDTYPPEVVADLSRRHARIFCESGVVHIADMGSKNGTAVNGVDVRQKTARLQDGDEIRFGRDLRYRVQLRIRAPQPVSRLVSLTLYPVDETLGLHPIVVRQFPFLISKADDTFGRYRKDNPQQVNYLSRRHAHLFLKRGMPFVEDLGSTNGTFVGGRRLDEHAAPLTDGETIGFGGRYFVYRIQIEREALQSDPTLTQFAGAVPAAGDGAAPAGTAGAGAATVPAIATTAAAASTAANAANAANAAHAVNADAPSSAAPAAAASGRKAPVLDADRTTFIAAPDSFLDIFCVDPAPVSEVERNPATEAASPVDDDTDAAASVGRWQRSRLGMIATQFFSGISARDRARLQRGARFGGAALVLAAAAGVGVYLSGASDRAIRALVNGGRYAEAATLAMQNLQHDPDNPDLRALATEAWLKAYLPQWLAALKAGDFDGAQATLATMRSAARRNPDALPLLQELAWIGELERFVATGPGAANGDAPIRIYADEDRIAALVAQWDRDPAAHQRAASAIAAQVPAFRDAYAAALSRLRRLQSDNAVYLAALERLKSAMAAELAHDRPDAIDPLLTAYADKYPRLAGLDRVRADLQHYRALDRALRAGRIGPLIGLQEGPPWSTPLFRAQAAALKAAGKLPSDDVIRQYQAVRTAWQAGKTDPALRLLQAMGSGPWADAVAAELAHKRQLIAQWAALQEGRERAGHVDQLMAFHETLEPGEDRFFIDAVQADPGFDRARLLRLAQDRGSHASTLWQRYREEGTIDDSLRQDEAVSDTFRTRADWLAQARREAAQALNDHALAGTPPPASLRQTADAVDAETDVQRHALLAMAASLPADVLKLKLALIDGGGVDDRNATPTSAPPPRRAVAQRLTDKDRHSESGAGNAAAGTTAAGDAAAGTTAAGTTAENAP
jgi:pSer/pThr/pTyr-binding forkhead associated (FHA) protein